MTSRADRRSPLAMVVLSLLDEEPMHAYRVQQLIRSRHKDDVVNVAQRNSVYQTIERLQRAELVAVRQTAREAGRPERTVYEITDAGRAAVREWLRAMLQAPAREYPEFPAALAFLPVLAPDDVRERLQARTEVLAARLDEIDGLMSTARRMELPRLFSVENEYERAVVRAELEFVRELCAELADGSLTWSPEFLRAVTARFEGPSPSAPAHRAGTDG